MKKAFFGLLCLFSLMACDKLAPKDNAADGQVEAKKGEKVIANFDVDNLATEAFKKEILAQFPVGSDGALVEKALAAKGFDCGPDPMVQTERACTNAQTKEKCVIMSIVKTMPYTPDGAQIIKACDVVN